MHNIFRVIKSRRMRLAGHLARMGEGEMYTEFWWGKLSANSKRSIKNILENTMCATEQKDEVRQKLQLTETSEFLGRI